MTLDRRTFLQYASLMAGGRTIGSRVAGLPHTQVIAHTTELPDESRLTQLAQRAIDAAIAAGAAYADVRVTHQLSEAYASGFVFGGDRGDNPGMFPRQDNDLTPMQSIATVDFGGGSVGGVSSIPWSVNGIPAVVIGIGIRAFVHGYWGFASSATLTDAEVVRLGQTAAAQAAVNARAGRVRPAELGTVPLVRQGRWVQSGIDPFAVPVDEKLDIIRTLADLLTQGHRFTGANLEVSFQREERIFASSEGASYAQVRYWCGSPFFPTITLTLNQDKERGESEKRQVVHPLEDARRARGWEVFRDIKMDELAEQLLEQVIAQRADAPVPTKPVDIGRYDVVFGAEPTAWLVYQTLGVATELDRAMGYEANAGGTSYLGPDPLHYLGTPVASSHVSLIADRTTPHALATAQWDDEGLPCRPFPLIQDGILVDYQTTREQAHWLADWYTKRGMPVQSNACAVAGTALDCPIQMSPNFVLQPGPEAVDVDDLIKDTERGVYFPSGAGNVDQQAKNGILFGVNKPPREIRNGRLGASLHGAGVLFTSQELWKNVMALGGQRSARFSAARQRKGEPSQESQCNVCTVPMKVKDCAIIDVTRKA